MCNMSSTGRVFFVGAGPGAGDLITVKGARRVGEADLVLWPSGVVAIEVVREHSRSNAELIDCARLSDEKVLQVYRRAATERLTVARLVPGDAALWSGLQPHYDACHRLGLPVEIVPGVSTLTAVVASTGRELTEPAVQLAQLDDGAAQRLAGDGTVAVTAPGARTEALVAQLRAAGRGDDTPVVVGYRPSRTDGLTLTTTLGDLERTVKQHRLWLPALFLVGRTARVEANGSKVPATNGVRVAVGSGLAAATERDPLHHPYRRRRRNRSG